MDVCMCIKTPVGDLLAVDSQGALTQLVFGCQPPPGCTMGQTPLLEETQRQLLEYFAGKRQQFDLPLRPEGTPFRQQVWQALLTIPYGQTRSYRDIAALVGAPRAVRAVGGANHHNPISIIIPCHRVIGADGSLRGYGGGTEIKTALLALEREHA